jgi:hypothetical protein
MSRRHFSSEQMRNIMPLEEVLQRYCVALEPCPFCCRQQSVGLYMSREPRVVCTECGAEGPHNGGGIFDTDQCAHSACLAWNKRTPPTDYLRVERRLT